MLLSSDPLEEFEDFCDSLSGICCLPAKGPCLQSLLQPLREGELHVTDIFSRNMGSGKLPLSAAVVARLPAARKQLSFLPCLPNCTSSALHLSQGSKRRNTYQFKYAVKDKTILDLNFVMKGMRRRCLYKQTVGLMLDKAR